MIDDDADDHDEASGEPGHPLARTAALALGLPNRETLTRALVIQIEPGRLLHLGCGAEALVPPQIADRYRGLRREQAAERHRLAKREWEQRKKLATRGRVGKK